MRKTFYSVVYAVWGSDFRRHAWFDDYAKAKAFAEEDYTDNAKAKAFAEEDYTDNVVQHSYTNKDSIKKAKERVAATLSEFGI